MSLKTPFLIACLLLAALFFSYRSASVGLFDLDEGLWSESAREMLVTGNFVVPQFNFKPLYDKPPLYFWLVCLSFKIFGVNEFGARFVSLASSLLLVIATYFFVRMLVNRRAALLSALALTANTAGVLMAKAAVLDPLLTLFIALSVYSFMAAFSSGKKYLYLGSYACAALAFLTKGPIGLIVPLGAILPFIFINRSRVNIPDLRLPAGILLFAVICVPWYALAALRTHGVFLYEFFLYHNLDRFTQAIDAHSGPVFIYIPVLLVELFPWSAFLPAAIARCVREIRRSPQRVNGEGFSSSAEFLAALWLLIPFVIISLARTKLPNYILPVLPPAGILVGIYLDRALSGTRAFGPGMKTGAAVYALLALSLAAPLLAVNRLIASSAAKYADQTRYTNPYLDQQIRLGAAPAALAALIVLSAVLLYLLLRAGRLKTAIAQLAVLMAAFNFIAMGYIAPEVWRFTQGSLRQIALTVSKEAGERDSIVTYGLEQPSLLFYSGRGMDLEQKTEEAFKRIMGDASAAKNKTFLITASHFTDRFASTGIFRVLYSGGGYVLLDTTPSN
jgi:4-amino-4-deoxy-L-arabinose transferase-like glycosyltransferase